MYVILLICLVYAARQGKREVMYILGGLLFGLLLEYMEVVMGSCTYGKFDMMFGRAPLRIPLCIGVGWGFERQTRARENTLVKWVSVTILSLICSLFILYATEVYIFPILREIGINYKARFLGITAMLLVLSYLGWRKRKILTSSAPSATWLVPSFFHLYFGDVSFSLDSTWRING